MTAYKELLMKRDAFRELRNKIQRELSAHPETSGGEILAMDVVGRVGVLAVTGQYKRGEEVVVLTHYVTISSRNPEDI